MAPSLGAATDEGRRCPSQERLALGRKTQASPSAPVYKSILPRKMDWPRIKRNGSKN